MNIDYKLWPNTDGNLGNIKVQIPDGVNTFWPEGDALVHNFVYKDGKLAGFVDTKALTVNDSKSTIIDYDYFDIELPFTEGEISITRGEHSKYFNVRYSVSNDDNAVITLKYKGCKTLEDVMAVDPDYLTNDIVDGVWSEGLGDLEIGNYDMEEIFLPDSKGMFEWCKNLISFTSDLSSLTDGEHMFDRCSNLNSFSSDLSSLTNGDNMFNRCENLTTFNSDLSSLMIGQEMFIWCANLTTFSSNLSSLKYGNYMFEWCKNLTSFAADLSSLENGYNMFYNCKLDAPSVKNIIDTINTYAGSLALGMGCNNTAEDKDLFAQEVGYADMTSLLAALQAKSWDVSAQYTGRPTTTYGLRRPSEDTLPVFIKLEETEDHTDYTSMDGSKKYRLNWFHETTGSTDGYTQFASLEEAIEHFNIKPIERN